MDLAAESANVPVNQPTGVPVNQQLEEVKNLVAQIVFRSKDFNVLDTETRAALLALAPSNPTTRRASSELKQEQIAREADLSLGIESFAEGMAELRTPDLLNRGIQERMLSLLSNPCTKGSDVIRSSVAEFIAQSKKAGIPIAGPTQTLESLKNESDSKQSLATQQVKAFDVVLTNMGVTSQSTANQVFSALKDIFVSPSDWSGAVVIMPKLSALKDSGLLAKISASQICEIVDALVKSHNDPEPFGMRRDDFELNCSASKLACLARIGLLQDLDSEYISALGEKVLSFFTHRDNNVYSFNIAQARKYHTYALLIEALPEIAKEAFKGKNEIKVVFDESLKTFLNCKHHQLVGRGDGTKAYEAIDISAACGGTVATLIRSQVLGDKQVREAILAGFSYKCRSFDSTTRAGLDVLCSGISSDSFKRFSPYERAAVAIQLIDSFAGSTMTMRSYLTKFEQVLVAAVRSGAFIIDKYGIN